MARFLALRPCFIGGFLREPGEVVDTDAPPGTALALLPDDQSRPDDRVGRAPLAGGAGLPDTFTLVDGSALALSDIVLIAFKQSGLSPEDWNRLDDADRQARLAALAADFRWKPHPTQGAATDSTSKPRR